MSASHRIATINSLVDSIESRIAEANREIKQLEDARKLLSNSKSSKPRKAMKGRRSTKATKTEAKQPDEAAAVEPTVTIEALPVEH